RRVARGAAGGGAGRQPERGEDLPQRPRTVCAGGVPPRHAHGPASRPGHAAARAQRGAGQGVSERADRGLGAELVVPAPAVRRHWHGGAGEAGGRPGNTGGGAAVKLRLVLAWAALAASAADWPQFRGPNGTAPSDETGLPVRWTTTENVRWKAELPGRGASSPA